MPRWAFVITGTVETDTLDEALAAIALYTDPHGPGDEWAESDECPIGAMRYDWRELAPVDA